MNLGIKKKKKKTKQKIFFSYTVNVTSFLHADL